MAKGTRKSRALSKTTTESVVSSLLPLSPADPPRPESGDTSGGASDVNVHIILICGGITNVRVPIAIGARYDGLPFAGPTAAFDRLVDSWMTRAVDLGIIGSALGLLFPINLE